jgi:hypothetical protein
MGPSATEIRRIGRLILLRHYLDALFTEVV